MTDTLPCCAIPAAQHPHCCLCRCYHHEPARYDPAICRGCDDALAKRGLRRCKVCGERKALAKFRQGKPGVYARTCIACASKSPAARAARQAWHRNRVWTEAQIERRRERQRAWNRRNRTTRAAQTRRWRQRNPERSRALARAYRARTLEARRASDRRYRQRRKLALWFGGTR